MRRLLPLLIVLALAPKAFAQQGYQPGSTAVTQSGAPWSVSLAPDGGNEVQGTLSNPAVATGNPIGTQRPLVRVFANATLSSTTTVTVPHIPAGVASLTYSTGTPTGTGPAFQVCLVPVDELSNVIGPSECGAILNAAGKGVVSIAHSPATAYAVTASIVGATQSWPAVEVDLVEDDGRPTAAANNFACIISNQSESTTAALAFSAPCTAALTAGLFYYVTDFEAFVYSGGAMEFLLDAGAAGTCTGSLSALFAGPTLMANGVFAYHFESPLRMGAGDLVCLAVITSVATTFNADVQGFIAP